MINDDYLIEMFGADWAKELDPILKSEYFKNLGYHIAQLREKTQVYPEKNLVFRAFKVTPYSKVKVVILGMDPYNDHPLSADGLAFSNSRALKASPSVLTMLKEIDDEYPEWVGSIEHGRLGWIDLERWAVQGVFLYNVALTVEHGSPGSHIHLWKEFTTEVIGAINRKNDIVWVVFGNEAKKFTDLITNITHTVFKCVHPAAESYKKNAGFLGCGVFRKVNEELSLRNKQIIYW